MKSTIRSCIAPSFSFIVLKSKRSSENFLCSLKKTQVNSFKAQKRTKPFSHNSDNLMSLEYIEDNEEFINLGPSKKHRPEYSCYSQETDATNSRINRETSIEILECKENLDQLEVCENESLDNKKTQNVINYDLTIEATNMKVLDNDIVTYLISQEKDYTPDPYYFQKLQPNISRKMRLILLDWLMEVSVEFQFTRETFHYAVNYIDRFLSLSPRMSKTNLQLLGTTALFLAAKMEEVYVPRGLDFARITDNGYTFDQIKQMEEALLRTLSWKLLPGTLNMWANWCMGKWDIFIQSSSYAESNPIVKSLDHLITFKISDENSYHRYREMMQLIDIMVLDIDSFKYNLRGIVASSIYLLLVIHFNIACREQIVTYGTSTSFFLNLNLSFNEFFENFLRESFDFCLLELMPTIQYVVGFLSLDYDYDTPLNNYDKV